MMRDDVHAAREMRAQTEAFIEAVMDAYPQFRKLAPDAGAAYASDEPPVFDPYPILTSVPQIIEHVSRKHGVSKAHVRSGRKPGKRRGAHDPALLAQWEAYYLIRRWLGYTYVWIGDFFNGRDHTTIIHGVKRHCEINSLPHPDQLYTEAA